LPDRRLKRTSDRNVSHVNKVLLERRGAHRGLLFALRAAGFSGGTAVAVLKTHLCVLALRGVMMTLKAVCQG
jgi:hypothetical protein